MKPGPCQRRRWGVLLGTALLTAPPAVAGDAWWHADWPHRCRIQCDAGAGDVAFAYVALAGRTTLDGRDLRLIDANGQARGFDIIHHDPQLETLIQLDVLPDKEQVTWLYYGYAAAPLANTENPGFDEHQRAWEAWRQGEARRQELAKQQRRLEQQLAEARDRTAQATDAQRWRQRVQELESELAALAVPDPVPEPRPPTPFRPRRGVLLRVYRKSKPGHPETLRDFRRMINAATPEGAGFRPGISDGFNPFGVSDGYLSRYDGYLRIDEPGEYAFCTVSDDGSWVTINGKDIVMWPGAHDTDGARRGQKSGLAQLGRGVAHVQYLHEEGEGEQMAFLGWKPPSADHYSAIPPEQWLSVRRAKVGRYEARGQSLMAVPTARIESTYWIPESADRQVTQVRFFDAGRGNGDVQRMWSFGDGLTGAGRDIRHIYFRLGRPLVTLTVRDAAGHEDTVTIAPHIFQTDAVAAGRQYGEPDEYARAAQGYDLMRLAREDLALYAEFCAGLDRAADQLRAARVYLERFADGPDAARLAAAAARSALRPAAYDPRAADGWLQAALKGSADEPARRELLLGRAHALAWHLDQPTEALALYDAIENSIGGHDAEAARLRRRVLIGRGDVAVVQRDYRRAADLYGQADELAERRIAQSERLAKTGSYAYTVDDLLYRREYAWACRTLDQWEDEFPLQKLEGLTFFLRGKTAFLEHPGELAVRYLTLAEQVAPRGIHVPEAVWLRANAYLAMKRYDQALAELHRITADFTYTEFLEQALEKIGQCESELEKPRR